MSAKTVHTIACGCDDCRDEGSHRAIAAAERINDERSAFPDGGRAPLGTHVPSIAQVMNDPAASHWLKHALSGALNRDPVDAANDAEVLAELLGSRVVRS